LRRELEAAGHTFVLFGWASIIAILYDRLVRRILL
jgi:hypothetical protein